MGELKERQKVHERFICDTLGIKTKVKEEKYAKELKVTRRDCTTRALSTVLNIPFKEVLQKQLLFAVEYEMPLAGYIEISEKILKHYGFNKMKINMIDHISVAEFMYKHKKGKFIIVAAGHMIAYMNGVWYDNEVNFHKIDMFLAQYVAFAYTNQKIKEKELLINKNDYVEVKEHERKDTIKEMDREL